MNDRKEPRRPPRPLRTILLFSAVFAVSAVSSGRVAAQVRYATGQNVVPVFEGWERNADGSFNMVFGYMNRNYEEAGRRAGRSRQRARAGRRRSGAAGAFLSAAPAVRLHGARAEGLGQEGSGLDADQPRQDREGLRLADAGVGNRRRHLSAESRRAGRARRRRTIRRRSRWRARRSAPSPPVPRSRSTRSSPTTARPTARPSQSGSNARVEGPLMQAMVRLDRGVRLGVIWVVYRGDAKRTSRSIRARSPVDRRQGVDDRCASARRARTSCAPTPTTGSWSPRRT